MSGSMLTLVCVMCASALVALLVLNSERDAHRRLAEKFHYRHHEDRTLQKEELGREDSSEFFPQTVYISYAA